MNCCQQNLDATFDARHARKEMKKFLRKGPRRSTARLIHAIRKILPTSSFSLIDIGSGIGAIPFTLAEEGANRIIDIDASTSYQAEVAELARKRNIENLFDFVSGDFVQVAKEIEPADVVTLDRVICCYPDVDSLVSLSVAKARNVYAVVYPRSTWWTITIFGAINVALKVMRQDFQAYIHATDRVEQLVASAGFSKTYHRDGFLWQEAVFINEQSLGQ